MLTPDDNVTSPPAEDAGTSDQPFGDPALVSKETSGQKEEDLIPGESESDPDSSIANNNGETDGSEWDDIGLDLDSLSPEERARAEALLAEQGKTVDASGGYYGGGQYKYIDVDGDGIPENIDFSESDERYKDIEKGEKIKEINDLINDEKPSYNDPIQSQDNPSSDSKKITDDERRKMEEWNEKVDEYNQTLQEDNKNFNQNNQNQQSPAWATGQVMFDTPLSDSDLVDNIEKLASDAQEFYNDAKEKYPNGVTNIKDAATTLYNGLTGEDWVINGSYKTKYENVRLEAEGEYNVSKEKINKAQIKIIKEIK